jgi:hypothetical protein
MSLYDSALIRVKVMTLGPESTMTLSCNALVEPQNGWCRWSLAVPSKDFLRICALLTHHQDFRISWISIQNFNKKGAGRLEFSLIFLRGQSLKKVRK